MGRYSPSVLPDDSPSLFQQTFLDELRRGPERLRQQKADDRAEEEYAYTKARHEKLDPLEEALLHAQLYDKGIVPSEGGGQTSRLPDAIDAERSRGADLISGRSHFGDQGLATGRGVMAPGSFNPGTGGFNSPFPIAPGFTAPRMGRQRPGVDPGFTAPGRESAQPGGRVHLGGGYDLDPSQTERGRGEARQRRMIDAMVARGVPRDEAEVEVLGGLETAIGEHFHPGQWHPHTMADALDYEKQLIHARGQEQVRVAGVRDRNRKTADPRFDERRRTWVKQIGEPSDETEQDVLDALASGYSTQEILKNVPQSKKERVQRYLRRAIRHEQRGGEGSPE